MPGIYDLMQGIQQQGEQGRQRGLAQLLGKAYGAPQEQRQGILNTLAQRGAPDMAMQAQQGFDKQDDSVHLQMAKRAREVVALYKANPQMAQQIYQNGLIPLAAQAGVTSPPMQLDDSLIEGLTSLASAADAGSGDDLKSLRIGANGNYWAIRGGQFVDTGTPAAPTNQVIDTGNGFYGVDKRTLNARPVMTGGQSQAGMQYATSDGQPIPENEMPALQAAMQADQRGESFTIPATGGGQLRSAPPQMSPAEQARLGMEAQRLQMAQESQGVPAGFRRTAAGALEPIPGGPADPAALHPVSAAQRAKMQTTARKERMMLAANEAAVDQTVALIDSITARKGDLAGVTGMGRMGAKIPGTDWADVAAKLDTLKGRSAFGALQQMRANSPTGGALGQVSERELYLLQNAETQLQDSQSPESLAKALADYKNALLESKRRMREGVSEFYSEQAPQAAPQGGGVDDLLSKYGAQ